MKTTNRIATAVVAAALGIGIGTAAMADGGNRNAAKKAAVNAAAISLSDAIQTAEKEVGGRAIEAEVDRKSRDVYVYEVDVVTPDGIKKEVRIDMKTGEVVKVERDGRNKG